MIWIRMISLTFIEQKTRPMSDLNPFANEFSLPKNNQLVLNEWKTTFVEKKLMFDELIQKSLQSIDAIKNASKYIFQLSSDFFYLSWFHIEQFPLIMFLLNVINLSIRSIVQHKQLMILINIISSKTIVHVPYVSNFAFIFIQSMIFF